MNNKIIRIAAAAALILFAALTTCAPAANALAFSSQEEIADAYLYYYAPAGDAARSRAASRFLSIQADVNKPPVDATIARIAVIRNWDNFSEETRKKLAPYIISTTSSSRGAGRSANASTSCSNYVSEATGYRDSTHFRVVYAASGSHAASSSFVDEVLAAAEYSYTHEVTSMGLPAPKFETGKTKMYIYLCDLLGLSSYSLLGRTVTVTYQGSECAVSGNPAYMELDNDYSGTPLHGLTVKQFMEVTMSHEFLHAIQFGINCYSPSYWLLESNAVWMEDEVYPAYNDYVSQYLGELFRNLDTPVDHFSFNDTLGYGEGLFFKHITENELSPSFVTSIWTTFLTACANPANYSWCDYQQPQTPLIAALLSNNGKDLKTVYANYNVSNYTKKYADGSLAAFPSVTTTAVSLPTTSGLLVGTTSLDHLSARFYKFTYPIVGSASDLEVSFAGTQANDWRVSLIKTLNAGGYSSSDVPLTSGAGSVSLQASGANYNTVALVVNNVNTANDSQNATITFRLFPGAYSPNTTFSNTTAGLGSTGVPAHIARLKSNVAATLGSITYSNGGTGQTGSSKTWTLYKDVNADGVVGAGDTLLKQVTTTTGTTISFTGVNDSLAAGTDYNYIVLLDISRTLSSVPGAASSKYHGAKYTGLAASAMFALLFGLVAFPPARGRKNKKRSPLAALLLCAFLISITAASCGGGGGGASPPAAATTVGVVSLSLSPSSISLTKVSDGSAISLYGSSIAGPSISVQQ